MFHLVSRSCLFRYCFFFLRFIIIINLL